MFCDIIDVLVVVMVSVAVSVSVLVTGALVMVTVVVAVPGKVWRLVDVFLQHWRFGLKGSYWLGLSSLSPSSWSSW